MQNIATLDHGNVGSNAFTEANTCAKMMLALPVMSQSGGWEDIGDEIPVVIDPVIENQASNFKARRQTVRKGRVNR